MLDGVEMDLEPRVYATFDELAVYCERVASAVGLACIHIWGFLGSRRIAMAAPAWEATSWDLAAAPAWPCN